MAGRRGHGEDSIYFDAANGRWTAAVSLGHGPDGKRRRRKVTAATRAECADKLRQLHRDIKAGVRTAASYTVARAVKDWLAEALDGRSPRTVERNRSILRPVVAKLGAVPLRDLTPQQIRAVLADYAAGRATSTVNLTHECLERVIRHAEVNGHVARNVAGLIQAPRGKGAGRASRSLTRAEADALIAATDGTLHAYIVLSLTTGIRTEEARALRWDHIDLDAGVIDVWTSVRRHGDTKTESSRRTLRLPRTAATALAAHRKMQAEQRLRAGAVWQDNDLVFASRIGTPLDPNNVERSLRVACEDAGLRTFAHAEGTECRGGRHTGCTGEWHGHNWTPRELRHTFVSLMSQGGVAIEEIARLAGHSSSRVTEVVYRHELRPALTAGAEVMDAIFG
jgi:integrase